MEDVHMGATNVAWNNLNQAIENNSSKEELQNYANNLFTALIHERKMTIENLKEEISVKQYYIEQLEKVANNYKTGQKN
jgi:hypothetical protein